MESKTIKKSRYIFGSVFLTIALLAIDRIFLTTATINDKFIFGLAGDNIVAIFISALILLLIFFLIIRKNPNQYFAFSLLSAGVLSNIIERIIYGGVVDYINILSIPTFNLADILIIASLVLLIFSITNKKISH
jgi:signal peptidase II